MTTHHAQAVRMSEIAHRRSPDPRINYLAFDILSTQQGQIGIMAGWLELSEQSHSNPEPPMAWMGHIGPMPGMATDDQLDRLNTAPVPQMEEQFLRLMIRHHRGAVPMADAASRASSPQVAGFAEKMSAGQQSEVDLMQSLLIERSYRPETEGMSAGHPGGSDTGTSSGPSPSPHDGH